MNVVKKTLTFFLVLHADPREATVSVHFPKREGIPCKLAPDQKAELRPPGMFRFTARKKEVGICEVVLLSLSGVPRIARVS